MTFSGHSIYLFNLEQHMQKVISLPVICVANDLVSLFLYQYPALNLQKGSVAKNRK